MSDCSIVIPAFNRSALTRRCVAALLADPPVVEHEILVADDGSTDGTADMLAAYGARVRTVRRERNGGFAAACNAAAARASGRYLVFLNNDTRPLPGWLDALVRHAEAYDDAAVVGSRLLFPDDTVQHAGVVFCRDGYPRHLYAGFPAAHPAVNRSRPLQAVTAACALVRHEAFEAAGGFDTAFRNGFEDVDLCLRIGERGCAIRYCHESVLYHLESISEGRFAHDRENARLYRERWAHRIRPDDIDVYLEDGLLGVRYGTGYPIRLEVSPALARVEREGRSSEADRLLAVRSRQVFELLRETIRLTVRVAELELGAPPAPIGAGDPRLREEVAGTRATAGSTTLEAHGELLRRDEAIESAIHALQVAVAARAPAGEEPDDGGPASVFAPGSSLEYREMVRRIRELARQALSPGSTVLVVTRGDPELLALDGVTARHFPAAEDGEYAGHHPADVEEVVSRLERLRDEGARYLLLPSTAFWWLDHYAGLREHLETRGRSLVPAGEPCRIYELSTAMTEVGR